VCCENPTASHFDWPIFVFGKFHGADGPLLLQRLADAEDWRVRASTALALAPLSSDLRIIEGLLAALDDPNHHVANAAASSIGWSEGLTDQHLDRIATWISDHPDNQTVRASLLTVLARSERNDFVLNHVRETIKQQQPGLSNLLDAVALVQDNQAFAMLSGLAGSSDHTLSLAALDALATRWSVWQGTVDGIDSFSGVFSDAVKHASTKTVLAAAISLTNPVFSELGSSSVIASAYTRVAAEDVDATMVLLSTLGATNDRQFLPIIRRGNQHERAIVVAEHRWEENARRGARCRAHAVSRYCLRCVGHRERGAHTASARQGPQTVSRRRS